MVLVKYWNFFQLFILCKIGQKNVFYDILERKKRVSRLSKQEVKKVKKLELFQRG